MFFKISKKFAHNRITFVGLGNMGLPMAVNLQKSGFIVSGYDLNKDNIENFKKAGGHTDNNLNESIKESECIISMLPSFKATESVWNNAFQYAKKNTIFIDTSTFSPIDAEKIGKEADKKGFKSAIAPVSGGVNGAKNGTLSFMVGCEQANFPGFKDYLTPMGKNIYYCGNFKAGQVVKICNNLCLAISMAGLSESLALGKKLGVDEKILSEVMSTSTARCWSLDSYNPFPGVLPNSPASRNYENGYNIELIKKDLLIAEECAKSTNQEIDLGKNVLKSYIELDKMGLSKKDFGYIFKYIYDNKRL